LRLVDVPWDQALDVILKTNGLDKVQEGNVIRVAPVNKLKEEREILKEAQRADEDLQPLLVRYIRISYSNAEDLKPLIETVLTERGSVAVDSRTNQIIVKDIQRGIANVAQLVSKLDLRTPQVLLETQIVEASRSFLRDLGSEVGFNVIQSPETGNATGKNFPNSIQVQGSAGGGQSAISFPAAVDNIGSAVTALFASADGAEALSLRLSSLEQEGKVKIISRPSVATVNNKKAVIKSVEKIRVKTPDSGLSVATGEGAVSSGASAVATETFEVGIVLEVTPQASPDYYVLLDINAKSSTLGSTVVDGIPSEVERSATSTVLVSSGQTFALGGIYKITDKDTLDGVPFFKDLPGFGHFFRRSLVDNSHEELIFFITPRIVEGSFDDAAMKATL
ncbi:MAG: type IV pilus secretin PilQ, partial [Candidatus Dadabacteria bacterium]